MEKRLLSERDICSKYILPALVRAGWDLHSQIAEERTLTAGRIIVRGKLVARGKKKRADFVLYLKPNIPIAVIEAKDNRHAIGDGIQQALSYANMLQVPFAFSSNGDTRIDKRATNVSVLAAIGVRRDGQKVLLSIQNVGGESTAAWSSFLGDLDKRGLNRPEFVIVDGAPGLEAALAQLWGNDLPIQRCTVHKHRNLLAHAPKHLHEEIGADYRDMIYARTAQEVAKRRRAFLRKWQLKCRAVADSLEEAGDRLFTFTRLPPSQWKAARTTNAIERLNEEFRRRIKTQTVPGHGFETARCACHAAILPPVAAWGSRAFCSALT